MERRQLQGVHELSYLCGEGGSTQAPVVFVHGLGDDALTWAQFGQAVGDRTWYALDLPGHGFSAHQAQYSFDDDAAALAEFVLSVSGPSVLVGHSRGGLVISLVASRRPDLVTGMFLEDVTPMFWHPSNPRDQPFFASVFRTAALAVEAAANEHDANWIVDQIAALPHDREASFGQVLTIDGIREWAEAVTRFDPGMFGVKAKFGPPNESPEAILSAIGSPVHLAHGETQSGGVVSSAELDWFHRTARSPSSTVFPGLGHFVRAARPSEFSADLTAFLQRLD